MHANAGLTLSQMKAQLAVRFSDVIDNQMALSLLKQVRQNAVENNQNYAERILSLAEEAYDNQGRDAIERQLTDIFVDGLLKDQLNMTILRNQPDTLQGAIAVATNEHSLRARVQMSHHSQASNNNHTPMEVDHSSGQRFKFKNRFNRLNSAINTQASRPNKCWHCGQEGHIGRDCRNKEQQNRPPVGHGRLRLSNQQQNQQGN